MRVMRESGIAVCPISSLRWLRNFVGNRLFIRRLLVKLIPVMKKKAKKNSGKPAAPKSGSKPSTKKTANAKKTGKNWGKKPASKMASKSVAASSAPKKTAKKSKIKTIDQLFPQIAMCQICKVKKATRFTREPNANGLAIHRFTCGVCARKWSSRPVEITEFFSSPGKIVSSLAQMDDNNTDWASFGKMMSAFREATVCSEIPPA